MIVSRKHFSINHIQSSSCPISEMELPTLPCSFESVPSHIASARDPKEVVQKLQPFKDYETKLRKIYAQEPNHKFASQNHLVPIYQDSRSNLPIRAREVSNASKSEQEKYLLPLTADKRRKNDSNATTTSLREFKKNFDIFSESSLVDLNWDNVVAAGSSVLTALLPVDAPHNESKVSQIEISELQLTHVHSELYDHTIMRYVHLRLSRCYATDMALDSRSCLRRGSIHVRA